MCTAITLTAASGDILMGRTMDFSYALEPELYVVPAGYKYNSSLKHQYFKTQFSFIGSGQNLSPITFADGVNEAGLCAAALYFPGYAVYDQSEKNTSTECVAAASELVSFLLGMCASVEHALSILPELKIVGIPDLITNSAAPLHWLLADFSGRCVAIEKTCDGLNYYENNIGVLSNSPDFIWHMTNLRNYINIVPAQQEHTKWKDVCLSPFGQGAGTLGLPGDFSPTGRFVRAAWLKSHITTPADGWDAVIAGFHVLDNVSIPKGCIVTDRGSTDYTQYTIFYNLTSREVFFKTYDNSQITAARLLPGSCAGDGNIQSLGGLNTPASFIYRSCGKE